MVTFNQWPAVSGSLWLTVMGVTILLAVSGCGSKPPGCAEPQTVATVKDLLVELATPQLLGGAKDDSAGMVKRFSEEVKVELSGIVSEGYSGEKRKQSCKATMRVTHVWGEVIERPIEYSTQLTEDRKHDFILEVEDFQQFARGTGYLSRNHFLQMTEGGWVGTYAGKGDGDLRVEIGAGKEGDFVVDLATTADGCGGAVSGAAKTSGNVLHFVGKDGDAVCQATLRAEGRKLVIEEGRGCLHFHGAACGLDGELTRLK